VFGRLRFKVFVSRISKRKTDMRALVRLALCGLVGVAMMTGCGGPDPAQNPNFNKDSLKDPTAVKIPDEMKSMGAGGPGKPGGAPAPGAPR
jgi:hypothetical protein